MAGSRLIASLSQRERERIGPYLDIVELDIGQGLIEAGEPIDYVWLPHDCVTSTVVDTPEGATIEVGLMGMEGMVGLSLLFGRAVSNSTVFVQVNGTATRMSAANFVAHVRRPAGELYERLLWYADTFMAMVAQTAACNSLHTVDERLARWILLTHDRVNRDLMPLTHEFLSFMLGVRRSSVSVAAAALQQMGLIKYSRGSVMVVDREGLEEASCACYGVVHDLTERFYRSLNGSDSAGTV